MGITIIQKSDLSTRKRNPKVALVLAGGAVTGGAFKLGGLKALDDFLINRKTTDFDLYVGLSAGALLSAPLAAGVAPSETLRALDGSSNIVSRFLPRHFYQPNYEELARKPVAFVADLALYVPRTLSRMIGSSPHLVEKLRPAVRLFQRNPSLATFQDVAAPVVQELLAGRIPMPQDYLPSGLFDNSNIELYLRENFERNGIPNDFKSFHEQVGKELYICAMNLDTAEQVVFGHNTDSSATISQAIQASTALPGFYKPARINGIDYVDGGVRRTANLDVAIEHGADLIICYNPFRPFSNRVHRRYDIDKGEWVSEGTPIADSGMVGVINQVFRTLLHTRLQYGLREYQNNDQFHGDIIVVEPADTDVHMFGMNPLALWDGPRAGRRGYTSVTHSIDTHYDIIKQILGSYGILMTRREVRAGLEKMNRGSFGESSAEVLLRDVPRRNLGVA
ncbi:MAG TPA: patatin-like phospholipase family protein [Candidatus Limnocylindrales bacterium]|nr:patatin-like phospholipase family protein [Candidatus Limnocylindrales bacterium]